MATPPGWAAARYLLLALLVAGLWYSSSKSTVRIKAPKMRRTQSTTTKVEKADLRTADLVDEEWGTDESAGEGTMNDIKADDNEGMTKDESAAEDNVVVSLPILDADEVHEKTSTASEQEASVVADHDSMKADQPWAVRWLSPSDMYFSENMTIPSLRGCPPTGQLCRPHHIFHQVFVITLPRRHKHWLRLSQQLRRRGVPHTLVHAYDGKSPGMRFMHRAIQSRVEAMVGKEVAAAKRWHSHDLALLASQIDILEYLDRSPYESVLVLQDSVLLLEAHTFDVEFDRQARLLPPDWKQFYLGAKLELEGWDSINRLTDPRQLEDLEAGRQLTSLLGVRSVAGAFAVAWHRNVSAELIRLAADGGMVQPIEAASSALAQRYDGKSLVAWPFLVLPEPPKALRDMYPNTKEIEDKANHWSYAQADVSDADTNAPLPVHLLGSSPLDRWRRPGGSLMDLSTDGRPLHDELQEATVVLPSASGGEVAVPLKRGDKDVAVQWMWPSDAQPLPAKAPVVRPVGCPKAKGALCKPRHVFDEVVVITVPRRRDRWLRLSQQLRRHDIAHTLVHGYHGRSKAWQLMTDASGGMNAFGERWDPAELALFATHLDLLGYTRKRKLANLLVLEDDALLLRDARAFARSFDHQMRQVPRDWKLLYLGATLKAWDGRELMSTRAFVAQDRAGISRPFPVRRVFGAFALAWTHAAAGQMMKKLQARPLPIDRQAAADVATTYPGKALVFWPFLVIPEVRHSDLRQSTQYSRRVRYGGTRWNVSAHSAAGEPDLTSPPPISLLRVPAQ